MPSCGDRSDAFTRFYHHVLSTCVSGFRQSWRPLQLDSLRWIYLRLLTLHANHSPERADGLLGPLSHRPCWPHEGDGRLGRGETNSADEKLPGPPGHCITDAQAAQGDASVGPPVSCVEGGQSSGNEGERKAGERQEGQKGFEVGRICTVDSIFLCSE